jgi:hypothetical protein
MKSYISRKLPLETMAADFQIGRARGAEVMRRRPPRRPVRSRGVLALADLVEPGLQRGQQGVVDHNQDPRRFKPFVMCNPDWADDVRVRPPLAG